MRILITGDRAGGVGVHARTLAAGLAQHGHQVLLAVVGTEPATGDEPLPKAVSGLNLRYPLEWRSELAPNDLAEAARASANALAEAAYIFRPDLLHSNHFSLAACLPGVPTLLAVHSDVVSWWRAVRRASPPATPYHRWYRRQVERALRSAQAVVAPSDVARRDLAVSYGFTDTVTVIPNGAADPSAAAGTAREPYAVSLGRIWDEGKQTRLLLREDLGMRLVLAGDAGGSPPLLPAGIEWRGPLGRTDAAQLLAGAAVYIAPSRYDPFGLAPLEAALHGSALLLNDIASFREVWGEDACYFACGSGDDLARQLRALACQPQRRAALAHAAQARARQRYSAAAMTARYETLYAELSHRPWPHLSASPYGA